MRRKVATKLSIDKILKVMGKDSKLTKRAHLECIKTLEMRGVEVFTEGKKYKIQTTYGNTYLLITNEGHGHGVTEGGKFKSEYFKG